MTLDHNIGTSAITLASVPLLFYGNFIFLNSLINYLGGTGFITTPPVPHVRRHIQKAVGSKNSVFSTYHLPQTLLKRNMKIEKNQLINMHGSTCTFVLPKINLREILPKNERL